MFLRQSVRNVVSKNRMKIQSRCEEVISSGGVRKRRKKQVSEPVDPHDERPTFMKVVSNRRLRSISACIDNNDVEESVKMKDSHVVPCEVVNPTAESLFYEVSAMDDFDTPDLLRRNLHEALYDLARLFRHYPTVPGDPVKKIKIFVFSDSKDTALLLPAKHCAFNRCTWCGKDTASLVDHLFYKHETEDLRHAMICFEDIRPNRNMDVRVLALSVYNEAIAIAIRKGAPLASYSIDRRCLKAYMLSLTHPDTNALICILCARRFSHVHGAKNNKIGLRPLLTKRSDIDTQEVSTRFLNLEKSSASSLFGLRRYCNTYGTMSESVALHQNSKQFDYWHLRIPFEQEEMKKYVARKMSNVAV